MERVLVIDDEKVISGLIAQVLRGRDQFAADEGANEADLVALLAAHQDVVAIVCDLHLRGENGLVIHRRLAPVLRERKIAFLLLHGSGAAFRDTLPLGYYEDNDIVEVLKPMRSVFDIVGIIRAEVERLRVR